MDLMDNDITTLEEDAEYGTSKRDRERRLKRYRAQIESSRKWRKDYDQTWREMIDLYRNKTIEDEDLMEYDKRLSIAIGFATINVIYPSVSLQRPKITVMPNVAERTDQAKVAEAVVNYWWNHHQFQAEFRQAVKDYLIMGHGWVKTTYLFKEDDYEMDADQFQEELTRLFTERNLAIEEDPANESLYPSEDQIARTLPTVKTMVVEDHPQVERVSPFDLFVDPDATRPYDMRWIAQRIAVPLSEVKAKGKSGEWNRKVVDKMVATQQTKLDEEQGFYDEQHDEDAKFCIIYEHYDLTRNQLCTFADVGEDFLADPEKIPFHFGHPFIMLRNYEVPENFYPLGELECLEPLICELNNIRTAQMNDVAQFRRAYLSKRAWLDDKAVLQLKQPHDGQVIFATEEAPDDLEDVLKPVPTMNVTPDLYSMSEIIQNDQTNVSGVSDYQRGSMPEIRRTATEAGIIADAANARAADKLAAVETTIANIAKRLIQLGQQFLSSEQVARVVDEAKAISWKAFDAEAIQGEHDFNVEAGSTQPKNETFKRQAALQMMDAFSNPLFQPQPDPYTGQLVPVVDPRKLAEYVMREGFGISDASEFIVPEPEPPQLDPATGQMVDPATGMPVQPPAMAGAAPNGASPPSQNGNQGGPPPPPGQA